MSALLVALASLVVHEWGTFTSIAGRDGAALEWRPLTEVSDLPGFVYGLGGLPGGLRQRNDPAVKSAMPATVRMETPVLYFYADHEMSVSVKVDFPKGKVTEWYPQARLVNGGIDWGQFLVMPGADVKLPVEEKKSHYYPARNTDASLIRVCGVNGEQVEKFLFYRGVGTFELPLKVALDGNRVRAEGAGPIILFENRGGRIGYRIGEPGMIERPALGMDIRKLHGELERMLVGQGLYEKEARAMIETWRDQWFEEGLRAFYILPRKTTDEILPVTIEPTPKELVRVLVGRVEIITPETESAILKLIHDSGAPTFRQREEATGALRKYGRFAEPTLRQTLAKTTDPEIQSRIRELLTIESNQR